MKLKLPRNASDQIFVVTLTGDIESVSMRAVQQVLPHRRSHLSCLHLQEVKRGQRRTWQLLIRESPEAFLARCHLLAEAICQQDARAVNRHLAPVVSRPVASGVAQKTETASSP